ncbi:MAG: glycosyltransferase [Candidatus Andersenbacteria bacterium]
MEQLQKQSSSFNKGPINTCDIVLTTYQRQDALKEALTALYSQRIPINWHVRIIVCDDGSSKNTQSIVNVFNWIGQWISPLVLSLEHLGRSGARNAGIRASDADIVLLLADDIFLRPGSLAQHLDFHIKHKDPKSAALGYVMWDSHTRPSPFMEWMTHGGQQNNYDALLGSVTCDPSSFFYGSHVSVKKELLQRNMFEEKITAYGWEDLELGSRLKKHGLVLYVLHDAIGLHHHVYSAEQLLKRQRVIGAQKYLVNTNSYRMLKHEIYAYSGLRILLVNIMKKIGNKLNNPRFFQFIIAGEFWYGVHHASRVLKRENI